MPSTLYRLPVDFWMKLYNTCKTLTTDSLPPAIIDMSGSWLTPLIASVKMGVPYFNFDFNSTRYEEISKQKKDKPAFACINSLIGKIFIIYYLFFRK